MRSVSEVLKEMNLFEGVKKSKVDFGFNTLNNCLDGLESSGVISIFGYPAVGRTNFVLNLVLNILINEDSSVMYVSKRETAETLVKRLISIKGKLPYSRFLKGDLSRIMMLEVSKAQKYLNDKPLYIYEVFEQEKHEEMTQDLVKKFCEVAKDKKHKILIYDEFYYETHVLEKIRRELQKYCITMIVLSAARVILPSSNEKELNLSHLDSYLYNISHVVISINKPSYFKVSTTNESDVYFSVLNNTKNRLGIIKYIFDANTLKYTEIGEVDNLPYDEVDYCDFLDEDIPF